MDRVKQLLFGALVKYKTPEEVRRSRLLTLITSVYTFCMFCLFVALATSEIAEHSLAKTGLWILALCTGIYFVCQILARTHYVYFAAVTFIVTMTMGIFSAATFLRTPEVFKVAFMYLGIAYVIASFYFSLAEHVFYYFFTSVMYFLVSSLISQLFWLDIAQVFILNTVAFFMSTAGIYFREQDLKQIQKEHSQLLITSSALAERESEWRTILSSAPLSLFKINNRGEWIFVNQRWCDLSGLSVDESLGEGWKNALQSDEYRSLLKIYNAFIQGSSNHFCQEHRIVNRKKQKENWVICRISQQKNIDGQNIGFIGTMEDITELKHAQSMAFQSVKLATIGELAAGIAHEINNPLSVVIGCAKKISTHVQAGFDLEKTISMQLRAAERIKNIVDGFRFFVRADRNTEEPIQIKKLIEDSVDLIETIYEKDGIKLFIEPLFEDIYVNEHVGRLQQVILNLLSNAKDATEKKPEKTIKIKTFREKEQVIIEVADNGCGVDPIYKDKIFETFFTTKDRGKGTGLGLGICKSIVENYRGQISFRSNLGEGSAFVVRLPVSSAPMIVEKKQEKENVVQKKKSFQGIVLVVEDEVDLREILCEYLREMGFDVDQADNGYHAIEKISHCDYDFIVTDIQMPKMNGYELIYELKTHLGYKGKIIVSTGDVELNPSVLRHDHDEAVCIKKWIDASIQKPFVEDDVAQVMSHLYSTLTQAA